jgi:hypothetical protein
MQSIPPRNCPRCRGSMILERDWHGAYSTCIACGFVHEMLSSPPLGLAAEDEARPARQRRREPSHGKLRL